jgi:putative ABC transport system permease protein
VIRLIMMEMLPVILVGIVAGVIGGLLCGRFVESQLFGVEASDPLVFAIGAAILLSASMLATLIPAWRASRIDPMVSLRHD